MDFIEVIKIFFLGIIEGITEWLPVSSTGHMLLFNALFPLNLEKSFTDVFFYFIQFGAILAVLILFWKKLFPFKIEGAGMGSKGKLVADKQVLNLWSKVSSGCRWYRNRTSGRSADYRNCAYFLRRCVYRCGK